MAIQNYQIYKKKNKNINIESYTSKRLIENNTVWITIKLPRNIFSDPI